MKKHTISLFALLLYLLAVDIVMAVPKSETEVRAAAETFVCRVSADARPDASIESVEPYVVDGNVMAYIIRFMDMGFCLSGADDLVLPVAFYSPDGQYDPDNPELQAMLEEIADRTVNLRRAAEENDPVLAEYLPALAERARAWKDLENGLTPAESLNKGDRSIPGQMVLDFTAHWSQGSPYNDATPVLTPGSDEHMKVGCVATAMAQTMYYWKWPLNPVGTVETYHHFLWSNLVWLEEPLVCDPGCDSPGRLEWISDNGGTLRANGYWDFSIYGDLWDCMSDAQDTCPGLGAFDRLYEALTPDSNLYSVYLNPITYDWSRARDTHTDPPDDGDLFAAQVSYHAGLSVTMFYRTGESTASTEDVPAPMKAYFGYDNDAYYGGANPTQFVDEITWQRPIIMRGTSARGGHAWVAYGYNTSTDQFLMNLGWGGSSDGWYTMDSVEYHVDQYAVYRLAPSEKVKFVGDITPSPGGDGSPNNVYYNLSTAMGSVPDNTTLIMHAGDQHVLNGAEYIIDRPMTLKGKDVTISVSGVKSGQ